MRAGSPEELESHHQPVPASIEPLPQPRARSRALRSGILASGQVLATLAGTLILAVLSRLLTPSEYASYRQALLSYDLLVPLLSLGLTTALYYFLPRHPDRQRGLTLDAAIVLVAASAAALLALFLGGDDLLARRFHNPELAPLIRLLAPYPLGMGIIAAATSCLVARDRATELSVLNAAGRCLALGIVIPVASHISANHDPATLSAWLPASPIRVGARGWIGASAAIFPSVALGDGVVVGAGAVVTSTFPGGANIAGVPARLFRLRGRPSGAQ